eukprot:TRINITY_DN12519_c0_g1_i1.p1 TRINITY_DN12519_c0_g1~~TRINITY_DN12519_c0_g1_i1.p1  ORF type:complete len:183 (-),score=31.45 TRINITY_DN12519_c0_g1_i1:23-571(-)
MALNMKPGDWICPNCNDVIFASKSNCRKCNAPKPNNNAPVLKPGDWKCPKCSDINFGSRNNCRRCNEPKVQQQQPPSFKAGDWKCNSCNEHNFASRNNCRKCNAVKGSVNNPSNSANQNNTNNAPSNNNSEECIVCYEKPPEMCIAVCGHLVMCGGCATKLDKCPFCRVPYKPENLIKVYKA